MYGSFSVQQIKFSSKLVVLALNELILMKYCIIFFIHKFKYTLSIYMYEYIHYIQSTNSSRDLYYS